MKPLSLIKSCGMTLLMLAIFTVMIAIASRWGEEARFMPFVVGIPAIGLCLLQLLLDWRKSRAGAVLPVAETNELQEAELRISRMTGREMHFDIVHDAAIPVVEDGGQDNSGARELLVWLGFAAMLAGIVLFGFAVTVPVFLGCFLYFFAGVRWALALLGAALATAFIVIVFELVLQTELHRGILTPQIISVFTG